MKILFLVVALVLNSLAFADTVPATLGTSTTVAPNGWRHGDDPLVYSSKAAACDAWSRGSGVVASDTGGTFGYGYCWVSSSHYTDSSSAILNIACLSGMTPTSGNQLCTGQVYQCPSGQNWTLSGSSCTRPDCSAGEVRNGSGVCVPPVCPVGGASTATRFTGVFATGVGQGVYGTYSALPATLCDGACVGTIGAVTSCDAGTAAKGSPVSCTYSTVRTGAQCSGDNGAAPVDPTLAAPSPPCAPGQGVITGASGKVVCVSGTGFEGATTPPVVNKTSSVQTDSDGSTKTTTITQTCTGAGACSSTTTTTITGATAGGAGTAGTPGTSTTNTEKPKSETSDLCAQNPGLQICKGGMNEEATQKQVRDELKKLTTPDSTDDSSLTNATHSAASQTDLEQKQAQIENAAKGATDAASGSKSAWEAAMSSGWWSPVPSSSCQPITSMFGGRQWVLDVCPTAARISEIGSYALWFMLSIGLFVMLTGGRKD